MCVSWQQVSGRERRNAQHILFLLVRSRPIIGQWWPGLQRSEPGQLPVRIHGATCDICKDTDNVSTKDKYFSSMLWKDLAGTINSLLIPSHSADAAASLNTDSVVVFNLEAVCLHSQIPVKQPGSLSRK